jgi:hypothetical protein
MIILALMFLSPRRSYYCHFIILFVLYSIAVWTDLRTWIPYTQQDTKNREYINTVVNTALQGEVRNAYETLFEKPQNKKLLLRL